MYILNKEWVYDPFKYKKKKILFKSNELLNAVSVFVLHISVAGKMSLLKDLHH